FQIARQRFPLRFEFLGESEGDVLAPLDAGRFGLRAGAAAVEFVRYFRDLPARLPFERLRALPEFDLALCVPHAAGFVADLRVGDDRADAGCVCCVIECRGNALPPMLTINTD